MLRRETLLNLWTGQLLDAFLGGQEHPARHRIAKRSQRGSRSTVNVRPIGHSGLLATLGHLKQTTYVFSIG